MEGMTLVIALAVIVIACFLLVGVCFLKEINDKLKVIINKLEGG